MSNYDWAVHWVIEREKIRLKKEAGEPYPWTEDPILHAYRFCNVRREDDAVTRWIEANIRKPYAEHRLLWLMLCISRMINWPRTLEVLMNGGSKVWPSDKAFDPEEMGDLMAALPGKVFTGAYVIPAGSKKGVIKGRHISSNVIGPLWKDREKIIRQLETFKSMKGMHRTLTSYSGWGDFLAYQAVVDMRFTPLLSSAADVDNWAAAGPGTIRGLNRMAGRPLDAPLSQDRALVELRHLWPRLVDDGGVEMDFSDVPNVMCETDKYLRVRNGEGTPRARYVPRRGS